MKLRYLCCVQDPSIDTIQIAATNTVEMLVSDSISAAAEIPVTSLFSEHHLKDSNQLNYLERKDFSNGFGFAILFVCAGIVVYLQRSSDGIFARLFRSSFDGNIAQQEARIESSQQARNLFILQVTAVISISLFISAGLSRWLEVTTPIPTLFFQVLGGVLGFVILKRSILRLLAFIFELRGEIRIHSYNLNILIATAGVSLLPLTLLLFYSPSIPINVIVYTGIVIGSLFHLKGLQRGLSVALNSSHISPLHLFYYFCALEILPVFVLIRLAQNV